MEVEGSFETPSENPSCGAQAELPRRNGCRTSEKSKAKTFFFSKEILKRGSIIVDLVISRRGLVARMVCRRTDAEREHASAQASRIYKGRFQIMRSIDQTRQA